MLDHTRIKNSLLFSKLGSAEDAAALITHGMTVGVGGFTPSGYPKKTAMALAQSIREGKLCKIHLWSGASVGPEIEEELSSVGGIASRMPYYASSNHSLAEGINDRSVDYVDIHLSEFAQEIDYGFYGSVDIAIIEAAAIDKDGNLLLGSGVGNTPMLVKHARKVIVEINTNIPLSMEGMHDIYLCGKPPHRKEIPILHPSDRIGTAHVPCGIEKIACIVESDIPDHVRSLGHPDKTTDKIGQYVVEFLENEYHKGRIPKEFLPIQSGVGKIANAVLSGLSQSQFHGLQMYSEILQDAVFSLIKDGHVSCASGCAFTPSPHVWDMYNEDPDLYRKAIILRPLDITNNPEVIRRLGVVAINTPIEFDIYGQANSTHAFGSKMINGIGGSGDYMRNGYLSLFTRPSTAKEGRISCIVPMVTHADHTEHDTMVFITEQGIADIRGLPPVKRAELIIQKCAHPEYRDQLQEYLDIAKMGGGHMPVDLAHAFDMSIRYEKYGTMKILRRVAI